MKNKINAFILQTESPFTSLYLQLNLRTILNEAVLKDENLQQLLHSNQHFDCVIVEQVINKPINAIAAYFNAPLIGLSVIGANSFINYNLGNPAPFSYIPHILHHFGPEMSFTERVMNTLYSSLHQLIDEFIIHPRDVEMIRKYIGSEYVESYKNFSIMLLNSHPSTNQPVPYVPSMIDIGGYHIEHENIIETKLSKSLRDFLDDSGNEEGFIYFSVGTFLKSADFPSDKRRAILNVFSRLKQRILWKWEEDTLPEAEPDNLRLEKWVPQQEILAHPKIKLFITHGGFQSTLETVYHGVPILAIPFLSDQKFNAQHASHIGIGRTLNFIDITEERLEANINELLKNPSYTETIRKRSKLLRDRPEKPLDKAIFWVEYVIRNKGVAHLRVDGLDLAWYQYFLLDVVAFCIIFSALFIYISTFLIKIIIDKIF